MTNRDTAPAAPCTPDDICWWLLAGTERCEGCGGTFAYEVEVRCVSCDAAFCPFCAVTLSVHAEGCSSCLSGG